MNRYTFYFDQRPTEDELNNAFAAAELADHNVIVDENWIGIWFGLTVAQHAGTPNLTVDVVAGVAYDNTGRRVAVATNQTADLSLDINNISTAVANSGKEKYLALCVQFLRADSDPRTDGHSVDIDFQNDESFRFRVIQGLEANTGTASRPTIPSDHVLLCDVHRTFGQTQIFNSDIETTNRRQDLIVLAGTAPSPETPTSIRRGRVKDVLSDLLTRINAQPFRTIYANTVQITNPTGITGDNTDQAVAGVTLNLTPGGGSSLQVGDLMFWFLSCNDASTSAQSPADGNHPRFRLKFGGGTVVAEPAIPLLPGGNEIGSPMAASGMFPLVGTGSYTLSLFYKGKGSLFFGNVSNGTSAVRLTVVVIRP